MPTRILRDWTDSLNLEPLSAEAERLFVRLIMKADDYGRYHADVRLLRAGCFPLLTSLRDADITRWIAECVKAGLVAVYEVKSRKYLAVCDFRQRTRQQTAKFPPPDGQPSDWVLTRDHPLTVNCPSTVGQPSDSGRPDSDSDSDSEAGVAAGAAAYPPGFLRVWAATPKKGRARSSQVEAFAVWKDLKLEPIADQVLRSIQAWSVSEDWTRENGKGVPGLHRWLKRRKWTEEADAPPPEPVEAGNCFVRSPDAAARAAEFEREGFFDA